MVWVWMHLFGGVVLVVSVAAGLLGPAKMTRGWAMIARVCYILIILSGVLMLARSWPHVDVLLVVKIILALVMIALAEIGFARKSKDAASAVAILTPIVLAVVALAFGLFLTHGFPIVMR
ncbi:hypothetical protein BACT_0389 [Bifidobacterium actinocoloniiforme DSM 22766]|uniref:Uncharacterized protein n=1 Tax=Bifidobacterium actinocoloniiforme DSM 22766 TaxID=1437605 RepID=A0A086YZI9_9BIFI|nr:DUF1516 family protein [Bifidobacterium actinocoloniiforme]AKV56013.1 hypothetical protein AB656_00560 [Bifidobacterium actinocoloniiforme DSM 22766]KFI39689.1 hypothetical protein BACT_0389 [Bifidobacterium actinocoloniiforme DSM 22766]